MQEVNKLNRYHIHYAFIIPETGILTKRDANIIHKVHPIFYFTNQSRTNIHAPTKEKLLRKLNKLKGKLHKNYIAYIMTDKQFSMIDVMNDKSFYSVLTTKQKNEPIKL